MNETPRICTLLSDCGATQHLPDCMAASCQWSERADKKHSWFFDGDDPYIICHYCGERRSALTGREQADLNAKGRSPDGSPALTSGCESPDSSPDCPRCAALTRGRAFVAQVRENGGNGWEPTAELVEALCGDLAQARQALQRIAGNVELCEDAHCVQCQPRRVAREALVERGTEQTNLGVAQSAPCESSAGEPNG